MSPGRFLPGLALWLAMLLCFPGTAQAAENRLVTDGIGRISALSYAGEWLPADFDLRVVLPEWKTYGSITPWTVKDVRYSRLDDSRQEWSGTMRIADARTAQYRVLLSYNDSGSARLNLQVVPDQDLSLEGVFFFFRVPTDVFAGGEVKFTNAAGAAQNSFLPQGLASDVRFLSGHAEAIYVVEKTGNRGVELTFDKENWVMLQDERHWQETFFSVFTRLHNGDLRKGETVAATIRIKLLGRGDTTPAHVVLSPQSRDHAFTGLGGNVVYARTSAVGTYNLANLPLRWARVQASLDEWEPENDNATAAETNVPVLEARDREGSMLREEFETARRLQDKQLRLCLSVWRLPEWLYADAGTHQEFGRCVAGDKWPELEENVVSYLLYAKRKYGLEPQLFSFNEPDAGVRVRLTPEEHRDTIVRLGQALEKAGLKTRLLLGDVTNPGVGMDYLRPAADSADAVRHIGALAFHSWGERVPVTAYAAWRDLAARLNLPLLVTEHGFDAEAWRTPERFNSYDYALQELRRLMEVLAYARPQTFMPWELTDDYPLLRRTKDADGRENLVPTARFWFLKQFSETTPVDAAYRQAESDQRDLLVLAFATAGKDGAEPRLVLHLANLGATRLAALNGIPAGIRQFSAWCTAADKNMEKLPPVPVAGGTLQVNLPAQSLTTLQAP